MAVNVTENVLEIAGHTKLFRLSHPIDLETRKAGGRVLVTYEPLGIDVYGRDHDEAVAAFAEAFEDAWEWLEEAPSKDLTGDARELKRSFRTLVRSVEPIR